jgi:hypothetical protein
MIMNDEYELEVMWNEVVVAYLEVLSCHLCGPLKTKKFS